MLRARAAERTDWIAKIYWVDLAGATNILGTKSDDPAAAPVLAVAPPAAGAPAGVAWALPPSIALMIFPKILIVCSCEPRSWKA